MTEELNEIIKKQAAALLKKLIALNVGVLFLFALVVFQLLNNQTYIVYPTAVVLVPILPLITIYTVILCVVRTKNPGAEKSIEAFCRKTENPQDTFNRLERTWKYGNVFQVYNSNTQQKAEVCPVHADGEYVIGVMGFGLSVKIIPLKNAVWIYADPNQAQKTSEKLHVFYADGSVYSQKAYRLKHLNRVAVAPVILGHLSRCRPDIALVYCKETRALWKNRDMAGLRAYARQTGSAYSSVQKRENEVARKGRFWFGLIQLSTLLPALGIVLAVKNSAGGAIENKTLTTALEVLKGYVAFTNRFYFYCLAATALVVVLNTVVVIGLVKSHRFARFNACMALACVGSTILFSLIMAAPLNSGKIKADINAIENAQLVTEYLYIDLDSLGNRLTGLSYGAYEIHAIYRVHAVKTGHGAPFEIYLPEQFRPDYLRSLQSRIFTKCLNTKRTDAVLL